MMNDKTQNIKLLGFLKAISKKEYPHYISKDFSSKVMSKLDKPFYSHGFFNYGLRIASAVTFAIITLFTMDSILTDNVKYSKSNIEQEILTPTRNVANQMKKCDYVENEPQPSDSLECQ